MTTRKQLFRNRFKRCIHANRTDDHSKACAPPRRPNRAKIKQPSQKAKLVDTEAAIRTAAQGSALKREEKTKNIKKRGDPAQRITLA